MRIIQKASNHKHYRIENGFLYELYETCRGRVGDKMEDMYKNRESSIPASYGLMVIEKKKKVEDEFEEFTLTMSFKNTKRKKIEAEECAFNSGAESGNNVALVQGIEQKRDSFTLQLC